MCLHISEGHGREENSKLIITEDSSHEAHFKRKLQNQSSSTSLMKPGELNRFMKHKIRKVTEVNGIGL